MKRSIFTTLLILAISMIAESQIRVGAQLGFNFSSASFTASENYYAAPTKSKVLFMGGLLAEYKLTDMFFIQPELNFVPRGVEYDPLINPIGGAQVPGSSGTLSLNYTEIPILFKAKFDEGQIKPYVLIGPNFGFLNSAETELRNNGLTTTSDTKDQMKSTNLSLDIGGGAEYAFSPKIDFFANLKYSIGLTNVLKDEHFQHNTMGLQLSVGIKYCISGCDEEKNPVYVDTPPPIIEKKKEREIIKEFDLGKYDVTFFVSGYYRPNTLENLDNLYELKKDELKGATYIESFPKGSAKYDQYKTWSSQVENIFHTIEISSNEEIFPKFKSQSSSSEVLEISVFGFADPRAITGKYQESEPAQFEDISGKKYTVNKGDDLDNLKLSGLRALNTGLYLEKIFTQASVAGKSDFLELKKAGKVQFRYIGSGVATDSQNLEAQRRVKIIFTRFTK